MGYTHYWRQNNGPATAEQWAAITNDFRRLLGHAPGIIQREDDDPAPPEIDDNLIIFNGIGDDGHETMLLRKNAAGFSFCKTARKPYDKLVVALLILAHHHAPDVWRIGSDKAWQPVLDWMNDIGPTIYTLPPNP